MYGSQWVDGELHRNFLLETKCCCLMLKPERRCSFNFYTIVRLQAFMSAPVSSVRVLLPIIDL